MSNQQANKNDQESGQAVRTGTESNPSNEPKGQPQQNDDTQKPAEKKKLRLLPAKAFKVQDPAPEVVPVPVQAPVPVPYQQPQQYYVNQQFQGQFPPQQPYQAYPTYQQQPYGTNSYSPYYHNQQFYPQQPAPYHQMIDTSQQNPQYLPQTQLPPPQTTALLEQGQPPKTGEKKKLMKNSQRFQAEQFPTMEEAIILTTASQEEQKKKEQEAKKIKEQEEAKRQQLEAELEAERQKKEAEEARLKSLQAQARRMDDIRSFLKNWTQDGSIFTSQFNKLTERKLKTTRNYQTNTNRSSLNKGSNNKPYDNQSSYNNKNNQRRSTQTNNTTVRERPAGEEEFKRGSNVPVISQQSQSSTTTSGGLTIVRYIEDNSIKMKKEEIKKNLKWIGEQGKDDNELKKQIKELKFKLNQLAPDNKDVIINYIMKALIANNDLAEITASFILDKAGLEPRYRELYTEVCKRIVECKELERPSEQVEGKNPKKNRQLFKDAILNKVQEVFESDTVFKMTDDELSKLKEDELSSYYVRRKNRILGSNTLYLITKSDVRFIGDLFIKKVLPEGAIFNAQGLLLHKYMVQLKEKQLHHNTNPEDQLEGLIELFDKAGQDLEEAQQLKKSKTATAQEKEKQDLAALKEIINTQNADRFPEIYNFKFSVQSIFQILDFFERASFVSTRIKILIQNLCDRRRKGWQQHVNQKNESAKSAAELQEQEDRERERQEESRYQSRDSYRDSYRDDRGGGRGGRKSYMQKEGQSLYQVKNQPQQSQQQQATTPSAKPQQQQQFQQYPTQPEKKQEGGIDEEVKKSFEMGSEEQISVLEDLIKRCSADKQVEQDQQKLFWKAFFDILLLTKKQNIERANIVYQFIIDETINVDIEAFLYGFQSKFKNEDYLYDTLESEVGKDLFFNLFQPFIQHDALTELEDHFKFDLPNEDLQEQWKEYMDDVGKKLIAAEPERKQTLFKFYQSTLSYTEQEIAKLED